MWKGGSEQHSMTPLPVLPVLPVLSSGTSIFNNPSSIFAHFCCPRPPQNRLQQALEAERDPGTSWGSPGGAMEEPWDVLDTICIYLIHKILKSAIFKEIIEYAHHKHPDLVNVHIGSFSYVFRRKSQ